MPRPHRLLSDLAALEQQLSQLVRGSNVFTAEQSHHATWTPPVDIYETPLNFILTAEVPGVRNSEIDIKVVHDTLILRGERRWEREAGGEQFHRLESSYGKFERTFNLSENIDTAGISAELEHGVLKVTLPKRGKPEGQQIPVHSG